MKSNVTAFAVMLAMTAQPVLAAKFTILGEGTTTCGEWLDKRAQEPNRVLPESSWVLGFVTAISRNRLNNEPDPAKGINGSAVDHWLDNHCTAHPLDNIETAAELLLRELFQRTR